MKKTLLLSSILCIFLSACGSAHIPATPTSTPYPTATVTPTIPPTETPTATKAPTATKEAPFPFSTLVKDIPFESSDYLFSTAFAEQVIKDEAAGKFPRNPNAAPLTSIDVLGVQNQNFLKKYGLVPIFEMSQSDSAVQKRHTHKVWSLVKLYRTEIGGLEFIVTLVRWENKDGTDGSKTPAGFTMNLFFNDPNTKRFNKDLMDNKSFIGDFRWRTYIPTGDYVDPGRLENTFQKYFFQKEGIDGKAFIDWYKKNQETLLFNRKFWQQCKNTGIFKNEITDANGQKIPFIPVSLLSGSYY